MRKISLNKAVDNFKKNCDETTDFILATSQLSASQISYSYDFAIIKLFRDFEEFIFRVMTGCLNRDSSGISEKTGIDFPAHINASVCAYLISGGGYFDFRGRDDLIKKTRECLGDTHPLIDILKESKYRESLDQLFALRNFAAHGSMQSKNAALKAVGQTKIRSSGSWLKSQSRYNKIQNKLVSLSLQIGTDIAEF